MSFRLASIIAAAVAAFALAAPTAEARTPDDALAGVKSASSRASLGLNTKSSALKRYAKTYSAKGKYASAKGKKKYASQKGKKRYASKSGKRNRLAGRAMTRYTGGTSRSCLQPQARALLNRIESRFGSVSIVSTCRSGAVIATTGKPSKHRYGLAIDFDAGSRKGQIVQWLIANHHSGGTMTYRDMSHIHVDVGARFVSLGASSGRT